MSVTNKLRVPSGLSISHPSSHQNNIPTVSAHQVYQVKTQSEVSSILHSKISDNQNNRLRFSKESLTEPSLEKNDISESDLSHCIFNSKDIFEQQLKQFQQLNDFVTKRTAIDFQENNHAQQENSYDKSGIPSTENTLFPSNKPIEQKIQQRNQELQVLRKTQDRNKSAEKVRVHDNYYPGIVEPTANQRQKKNLYRNYSNLQNNSISSYNQEDTKSFICERTNDTAEGYYENNHTNNENSYKNGVLNQIGQSKGKSITPEEKDDNQHSEYQNRKQNYFPPVSSFLGFFATEQAFHEPLEEEMNFYGSRVSYQSNSAITNPLEIQSKQEQQYQQSRRAEELERVCKYQQDKLDALENELNQRERRWRVSSEWFEQRIREQDELIELKAVKNKELLNQLQDLTSEKSIANGEVREVLLEVREQNQALQNENDDLKAENEEKDRINFSFKSEIIGLQSELEILQERERTANRALLDEREIKMGLERLVAVLKLKNSMNNRTLAVERLVQTLKSIMLKKKVVSWGKLKENVQQTIPKKSYVERRRMVSFGKYLFFKFKKAANRVFFNRLRCVDEIEVEREQMVMQGLSKNMKKKTFVSWKNQITAGSTNKSPNTKDPVKFESLSLDGLNSVLKKAISRVGLRDAFEAILAEAESIQTNKQDIQPNVQRNYISATRDIKRQNKTINTRNLMQATEILTKKLKQTQFLMIQQSFEQIQGFVKDNKNRVQIGKLNKIAYQKKEKDERENDNDDNNSQLSFRRLVLGKLLAKSILKATKTAQISAINRWKNEVESMRVRERAQKMSASFHARNEQLKSQVMSFLEQKSKRQEKKMDSDKQTPSGRTREDRSFEKKGCNYNIREDSYVENNNKSNSLAISKSNTKQIQQQYDNTISSLKSKLAQSGTSICTLIPREMHKVKDKSWNEEKFPYYEEIDKSQGLWSQNEVKNESQQIDMISSICSEQRLVRTNSHSRKL